MAKYTVVAEVNFGGSPDVLTITVNADNPEEACLRASFYVGANGMDIDPTESIDLTDAFSDAVISMLTLKSVDSS